MNRRVAVQWQWVTRISFFVVAAVIVMVLGVLVLGSWVYAYYFTHPGCSGERVSLKSLGFTSEAIDFETTSGNLLRGWFSPGGSQPDIAIIILPGGNANTSNALPDAALLAKTGYSTLIYEHRQCANPALLHSGGYFEAYDLIGAVHYLQNRGDIKHIGVLGFSTGGSAALIAASQELGIEAVIAEGGFTSIEDDALWDQPVIAPIERAFRRMILFFIGSQLGVPLDVISPINRIEQISPRPMFLIYGEKEAWHGRKLFDAALDPKQLWIVPGAGHGDYQDVQPKEYPYRVVEFFIHAFAEQKSPNP